MGESKVLIAIANVATPDNNIFTLEALQDIANKHPEQYVLEGDRLYYLLTVLPKK